MKYNYVKYDELKKKEGCKKFDIHNLPIFPKSKEDTVRIIVNKLCDTVETYGYVTLADLYDIVMDYERSLWAEIHYIDNKYGWIYINDFYVLHTDEGVTIGIQSSLRPLC